MAESYNHKSSWCCSFDFATMSGCDLLVVGLTHACGGTIDLLMTDVPNLVWVSVVAPIGNTYHSSLSAVIRRLRLFQTCVSLEKFSLKIKLIGIEFVVQCRICPGITFYLLPILLRF